MNATSSFIFSPLGRIILFLLPFFLATLVHWLVGKVFLGWLRRRRPKKPFINYLQRLSWPFFMGLASLSLYTKIFPEWFLAEVQIKAYREAVLIFFVFFLVIKLIDASFIYYYERHQRPFPLPGILHGFILLVFYLALLFVIFREILGINITGLLATSAILTAIIGLAFQGVLGNILAGISLNMTKSLSRGEWVKIGQHEGVVKEINWRETLLLDRYSNIIVIPNSVVAAEKIINFARPHRSTALSLQVKVSSSAPPARVLAALEEAARECNDVLPTPQPEAYLLSYDETGVSYMVKFWTIDFARAPLITTDVARLVWYKFKRQGIDIPIALNERFREMIHSLRPEEKTLSQNQLFEANFLDLRHSQLFRYEEGDKAGELMVSEETLRRLAQRVKRRVYARGEVLCRQGEKGETCYLIARGRIKGEIIYSEKGKKYFSEFELGPGEVFGEMSLFTGLPRTATGIITEEAELLEIDQESFAFLLDQHPQLAEFIAELVSRRNKANEDFLRKIKELSAQDIELSTDKKSILKYLKNLIQSFRKKT